MTTRADLFSLCLFALVGLAACKNASGPAGDTSEAPGASARAKAPKRRTIAVIPKGTTHEFWKSVHAGANKAARELGVDVTWKGPVREDDRAEQVRVVEDFVARGVDGIVLAPLDDKALVPSLKEATARKIPVVIIDSDVVWEGRASFVATDNVEAGAAAARRLAELVGKKGRVAMMRYLEGSASTMAREKGFLGALGKEFPDVRVVSENQYGGATTETAYSTAENLLVREPELDGVFCPNESTTFGMLRALQDAKRTKKTRFVGFDASAKLVEALTNGEIQGLVVQNPFAMGESGVRAAVDRLDGKAVEPRIDTGATVVTLENMKDPKVVSLLAPDLTTFLQ